MKNIIVTGGSRGIGAATVKLAAQQGYNVCFSYHSNEAAADAVIAQTSDTSARVIALQADASKESDVKALFSHCKNELGSINGLVNNAGILHSKQSFHQNDLARWREVIETNVIGSFLCVKEAIQNMLPENGGTGGSIVNVSSMAATLGGSGEFVDYAATKGAIDTMTIGVAKEVAELGIRVNAVRPGIIDTDIHASGGQPDRAERMKNVVPMKRAGGADEVAEAIIWLLGEQSSYVTGTFIDVSGGR